MTNAVLFPHEGIPNPIHLNNLDNILEYLSGDADEGYLKKGYSLFFNPNLVGEESLLQKKYGISGNFLICRMIDKDNFLELTDIEIEYVINNTINLIGE